MARKDKIYCMSYCTLVIGSSQYYEIAKVAPLGHLGGQRSAQVRRLDLV
jgi:hypothetical protein